MSVMQKHFLRLSILQALKQMGDCKLPERDLFIQLNQTLEGAISEAEMQEALKWLKEKGYIDFTIEELSESKRWHITESGKQRISK